MELKLKKMLQLESYGVSLQIYCPIGIYARVTGTRTLCYNKFPHRDVIPLCGTAEQVRHALAHIVLFNETVNLYRSQDNVT